MDKYLLTNWSTCPFKKKTFEGQMDRYAKVCVVSVANPQKVLDIIPLYGKVNNTGFSDIIKLIYDIERGIPLDDASKEILESLQMPVWGQFVEVNSQHGPLYRQFTPDEAKYGLCSIHDVWQPERDINGKVIEYMFIKVFTIISNNFDFGKLDYLSGWSPNKMYYKYYGYRYLPISMLKEPVSL